MLGSDLWQWFPSIEPQAGLAFFDGPHPQLTPSHPSPLIHSIANGNISSHAHWVDVGLINATYVISRDLARLAAQLVR